MLYFSKYSIPITIIIFILYQLTLFTDNKLKSQVINYKNTMQDVQQLIQSEKVILRSIPLSGYNKIAHIAS